MAGTSLAMTMLKDILRIAHIVMAGFMPAIHVLLSGSPATRKSTLADLLT